MSEETDLVAERYARRAGIGQDGRYNMLNSAVWHAVQERQRQLIGLLNRHAQMPVNQLRVLEIGCGGGGNLMELIRLGFSVENLSGNDLLPERVATARKNLPLACDIGQGDASIF